MRRDDAQGALALLAIAAALAALTGPQPARSSVIWLRDTPTGLLQILATYRLAIVGIVAVGLAVAVLRVVLTRRMLRSRIRMSLVPTDAFDPSAEAVNGFAAQLARTRRGVGGWFDSRASAVRVLIATRPDGLVGYQLEAPARARSALRAAAAVYGNVALQDESAEAGDLSGAPASEPTPETRTRERRRRRLVRRAELVLARPSAEPLAERGLDPDPLQPLAVALGDVRSELDETATIALDLRPVTPAQWRRLRARMLRQARRQTEARRPQPTVGEVLRGETTPRRRSEPADLVARRAQTRALQDKLGSPQPLFELQLLLATRSRSEGRARARLQALLSCFDAFAGENHLRVAGLRLAGLWFLGSDLPWRRRRFDRRISSGLFRPARRGVVTPAEIAGLLKPPTVHCQAPNVQRSGGLIAPPPPGLPVFSRQRELIPLGRVAGPDGDRLAGVRVGETVFSYMAGRSRYGKTETAIGQFVHLTRSGHGGLFLDPHADAITEIKTYLTDPGLRERVIEIDLSDLAGRHGQPGWNLFAVHDRPAWEAAERVEAVVDALASALGWDERNTRALNLATQAAQALTELALVLPPELAPTVFQVPTLLSNEPWRTAILPFVSAATRQFFTDRFPRLPAEAITPVTNLIDRLRVARPVAALLGAPVSTFDARRAIDDGQIVLACPGAGSTRDRLVANFLVYEVLHAAKARASVPPARRRPFWIFFDELQTYDGPNLPALLEQSAKYGGRAFLFNQNPERLSDATLNAVTTNRSHLATSAVNAKAASLLAREWGGEPAPATITQLARYTYLASVTLADRTTKPFLVRGVRARELHADAHHPERLPELEQAIDQTNRRRPVDQVLAALDDHDERILRNLRDRRRQPLTHEDDDPAATDSSADRGQRRVAVPRLPTSRQGGS